MSSFTYPAITKTYTNVLLIDSSVIDYQKFVDSVNSSTFPIVYSYTSSKTELLELFREHFTTISRIGICFTSPNIQFLDNKPFYTNDETSPYSENFEFIINIIKEFQVKNIDYLACNTLQSPEWSNYYNILSIETGVIVGASNDRTGNIKYGGDWVMETTSEDIELVYFTQSIEYYTFLLDSNQTVSNIIIKNDGKLWVVGNSWYGDSGVNTSRVYYSTFRQVTPLLDGKTPKHILQLGDMADVILMTDGTLYASGNFYYGNNFREPIYTFTKLAIPNGKTIKYIYGHSKSNNSTLFSTLYIITLDNKIYFLGQGLDNIYYTFTEITNLTGKIPVYIDGTHTYNSALNSSFTDTVVLMSDGTVYGIGPNGYGLFGIGNTNACSVLTPMNFHNDMISSGAVVSSLWVGALSTAILATNGKIYTCGFLYYNNYTTSTSLIEITNTTGKTPKKIVGDKYFMVVWMTDNTLYGLGALSTGKMQYSGSTVTALTLIPTNNTPIKSVYSQYDNIVVLYTNGDLYITGYGYNWGIGGSDILSYVTNNVSQLIFDPQLTPGVYTVTATDVHCFLEGSKILTINGYVPIEDLKQGDLIQIMDSTYIPIYKLGKRVMHHYISNERDKNILYKCSKKNYPELTEDLIITGCHSILIDDFKNNSQREETIEVLKKIYITDDKYRLPACVDDRTTIYETEGEYTVYHIALENDNDYFNYGIYANGLLVETCSKRFLNDVYDMNVY